MYINNYFRCIFFIATLYISLYIYVCMYIYIIYKYICFIYISDVGLNQILFYTVYDMRAFNF